MSDADVAEMLKLPAADRLRLVEILWQSLSADPATVPVSDAHRSAIDEELAEHRRNPDDLVTMEQVLPKTRRA